MRCVGYCPPAWCNTFQYNSLTISNVHYPKKLDRRTRTGSNSKHSYHPSHYEKAGDISSRSIRGRRSSYRGFLVPVCQVDWYQRFNAATFKGAQDRGGLLVFSSGMRH